MNHIEFNIVPPKVEGNRKTLGITLDGRSLFEMVNEVERRIGEPVAGDDSYSWIPAQFVLPPSRHFWGSHLQAVVGQAQALLFLV